jgi:excisionase family DNA binding protein
MKPEINRTIEERLQQIEKDVSQIKLMLINFLSNFTKTESKEESLLNVKDVSSFLKVDSSIIYAACSKGELPFIKIGKSYKFKKEDILKWIENGRNKVVISVDDYVNSYLQKHTLRG